MQVFTKIILLLCFFCGSLQAQITTNKTFPTSKEPLKITFDATLGTKGLMDYSGDIYAHIGVITNKSSDGSDWRYVVEKWAVNSDKIKCTRIEANKYELDISPTIQEYFGVPESEEIQQIAIVFRNADGSKEGKAEGGNNIFVNVYKAELSIKLVSPSAKTFFVDAAEQFNLEVLSSMASSLEVMVDGVSVHTFQEQSFTYQITAEASGTHEVQVVAYGQDKGETKVTGFTYTVRSQTEVKAMPEGVTDGINIVDENTVTLVLHAPAKESVYVIGNFNDWLPSSDYQMFRTSADTKNSDMRYWITLENLTAGKEYTFQYLVDEELRIADPYTEKVIDPWNDKHIPAATYPNLPAYPEGKTESVLSAFSTTKTEYDWQITDFEAPKKTDMVIYELLLRDFTVGPEGKEGNYSNAIARLDYLKDLGVNVVELMPVNEFEGNNSWGYNPSFMFAVDKAYGSATDLKKFIDECHKRGMAVVIDLVMNHQFGLSPFVQLYLDKHANSETLSLPESPWFNEKSPNQSYKWGADFNHESIYTQRLLDRVNAYWLKEFNVDGFRFDFTKGFTNTTGDGWAKDDARIAILKRMYDNIMKVNPEAYVILEHLTDNEEEKELAEYGMLLWGNMNHNYSNATKGNVEGTNSDLAGAYYKNRNWTVPHLITYMESHDEERLMYGNLTEGKSGGQNVQKLETGLYRVAMAANFFLTIPGPKMIWQFGELGYDISIDENGRTGTKPVKWDYLENVYREHLYKTFSALAKLKTSEDVFETGDVKHSLSNSIKTFSLDGEELDIVVVGNFDVYNEVKVPVEFTQTGVWYEYFTGEEITVKELTSYFNLYPGQYHFFTSKKLEQPEMPDIEINPIDMADGTTTSVSKVWNTDLTVFPNPTSESIILRNASDLNFIGIYDTNGRLIKQLDISKTQQEYKIDLKEIKGGLLYILMKNEKGQTAVRKVLKR